jgi:G:T-mismatch repair DNA endonuclease (very short patch repair protein)
VANEKPTFVTDEEKLIIFVQGHGCLYNLQHKDYDNHLVKDNGWKEIAGEVHAEGKKQKYFVHYRKAYYWYAFV